ncbi:MFS transporter [Sphingobacterium bambusae]|uniref:MFS transporter n=1 Tax=Sphingobacterium bambusae TaxID=662858 RepID=A0ABW6BPK9_9SPHI|nr:MFS transporter [Sphingobacterium bambusae]WPL48191.1 MFS transporter [Sphingobacterium bambusae]
MKIYNSKHESIALFSTFLLIPLSGLATDIYLPSFPDMQKAFAVSSTGIQMTLSYFLISYGLSMLFVGPLVDSFGRYKLVLIALLIFAGTNFALALSPNIQFVYAMRILQGICTAFIVVGKRAFLVDIFSGKKLQGYMSMLSIIWAIAPITAPFIGGYLQQLWGWQANFHLLGIYAILVLLLELIFSGEASRALKPFHPQQILTSYKAVLQAPDFFLGLFVLGTAYSMIMVFAMSAPFLVENHFGFSSVETGYCALLSGVGVMMGGFLGKANIHKPLVKKLASAILSIMFMAIVMYFNGAYSKSIVWLMLFVLCLHTASGFIYNSYFTYCLTRFPQYAGVSSGLTSGGSYLFTSLLSYAMVSILAINNQSQLAFSYFGFALLIGAAWVPLSLVFRKRNPAKQQV